MPAAMDSEVVAPYCAGPLSAVRADADVAYDGRYGEM